MNSATLYEMWESLRVKAINECSNETQNIYARYAKCSFGNAYISTNQLKDKAIIIHLPYYPENISFPNVKGLTFELTNIPAICEGKTFLKFSAKNQDCLEEAFEAFSVTLIETIKDLLNPEDVIEAIFDVIDRYLQFFSDDKSLKLSKKEEQGLFGELLFIKNYLYETGDETIISSWTGPAKNKHDFIFPNNVGVEVKTISSQTQKTILISNENQLNDKERKVLFLNLYVLEINPTGMRIDELIEMIGNKINSFGVKKHFNQKLLEYGLILNFYRGQYAFSKINQYVYKVDENFPRIIKEQLNENIFEVKYRVNLDNQNVFNGDYYEELRN